MFCWNVTLTAHVCELHNWVLEYTATRILLTPLLLLCVRSEAYWIKFNIMSSSDCSYVKGHLLCAKIHPRPTCLDMMYSKMQLNLVIIYIFNINTCLYDIPIYIAEKNIMHIDVL